MLPISGSSRKSSKENWRRIEADSPTAVILAGGASQRMGRCKALLPWGASTAIESLIAAARSGGCGKIVVVTGIFHEQIAAALAGEVVELLKNPEPERGMFSSLQVALAEINRRFVVLLVDQPSVPADLIAELYREPGTLSQPRFQGRPAHPVHVPAQFISALRALPTHATLRDFLASHRDEIRFVDSSIPLSDFDTPEEYERARVN